MNRFELAGNLTRDAELKYTNSGLPVCTFSIAENYKKKVGDNYEDAVSYYDLVLFGKRGESLNQYLLKGTPLVAFGRMQQDRWENDGTKKSKIKLIVEDIKLMGGVQINNRQAPTGSDTETVSGAPTSFADEINF